MASLNISNQLLRCIFLTTCLAAAVDISGCAQVAPQVLAGLAFDTVATSAIAYVFEKATEVRDAELNAETREIIFSLRGASGSSWQEARTVTDSEIKAIRATQRAKVQIAGGKSVWVRVRIG